LLKVDTTSAFQQLTSKPKEIEYCDEYQSSLLRAGNLTAEPEVNYSPKGSAVVSASIANNESYGCAGSGVGRISYASCEFTGKHYAYHDHDHYDHDRYYHEGQSDGNNYRSDRPSIDVHF
jgi:hypothetical protein